ncbi:flagellin [Pseudaquidulcibacter saccharophilus]|uniref:flagellin n=1 Tax=Pseudaquidulcibacter saccharophilus TaxID=2831900 RepID=UPI001EFF5A37|nr:flagellin [Pseudaquidulcibacter saccharophilus]
MTRISTLTMLNSNTSGLINAQNAVYEAQTQQSSEKVATDLKGYGNSAGILVDSKSLLQKLDVRNDNLKTLSSRSDIESIAYEGFTDAISSVRDALTNALANKNGSGLSTAIEGALADAMSAANTQFDGQYIFGGVRGDTQPVTTATLDALAAQPNTDANWTATGDTRKITLSDGNTIELSKNAEEVFRPFVDFLRGIRAWENSNTSLEGKLDDTSSAYISSLLTNIKTIQSDAINYQSGAGLVQKQIENKMTENSNQQTVIKTAIGNVVDVNLAEVAAKLVAAQTQYQAMASIFAQVKGLNLLPYLS